MADSSESFVRESRARTLNLYSPQPPTQCGIAGPPNLLHSDKPWGIMAERRRCGNG